MTTPAAADPLAPPRVLRTLSAADAPYPATLVAGAPARVWVDAEAFGDGPAWRADVHGHVLTPLDVARTATGHAVVLPHCTGRLADALGRRARLEAGEAVTAAVSLLRGAAEAERLGADEGVWWLTEELRPVLALTGGMPWRPETAALLAELAADQPEDDPPGLAVALEAAAEAVASERRLGPRVPGLEDALFAAAAPEPLARPAAAEPESLWRSGRTAHDPASSSRLRTSTGADPGAGPRRTRRGSAHDDQVPDPPAPADRVADAPVIGPVRTLAASLLGRELTDRVAHALGDVGRGVSRASGVRGQRHGGSVSRRARGGSASRRTDRGRADDGSRQEAGASRQSDGTPTGANGASRRVHGASRPRRRAPFVLAALVAAAVLAVGLSWPADARPDAGRGEPGAASTAAVASPSPSTGSSSASPGTAPTDSGSGVDAAADAAAPGTGGRTDEDSAGVSGPLAVVDRLAACLAAADPACRADVLEDPSRPVPPGIATQIDAAREVALLDDYGGVIALRVAAEGDPEAVQIVLLVRSDERRWLVRDVYDIADQP